MNTHEKIVAVFESYLAENEKFEAKGIKASATRSRTSLADLAKLCKQRRSEILDEVKKG